MLEIERLINEVLGSEEIEVYSEAKRFLYGGVPSTKTEMMSWVSWGCRVKERLSALIASVSYVRTDIVTNLNIEFVDFCVTNAADEFRGREDKFHYFLSEFPRCRDSKIKADRLQAIQYYLEGILWSINHMLTREYSGQL